MKPDTPKDSDPLSIAAAGIGYISAHIHISASFIGTHDLPPIRDRR